MMDSLSFEFLTLRFQLLSDLTGPPPLMFYVDSGTNVPTGLYLPKYIYIKKQSLARQGMYLITFMYSEYCSNCMGPRRVQESFHM